MICMHAASAASASAVPFSPHGTRMITLRESEAEAFRVGAYVELNGRIWKVAARRPAEDWLLDEVYVTLHGAHYVEGGQFMGLLAKLPTLRAGDERVTWLEDA